MRVGGRFAGEVSGVELPEGGVGPEESLLDGAQRELKEETGIEAKQWKKILELHLSNSVTDERSLIYLATDLSLGEAHPDEGEELVLRKISLAEAYRMVLTGDITDAIAVERQIKGWSRAKKEALIRSDWASLSALSRRRAGKAQRG